MLSHIQIRDFVIIDRLELELAPGMTALTGETGAGKSILIDAIGLVLGDRADSAVIRPGCERAEISLGVDLSDAPEARLWLQARELDAGDECVLRRVITREGRSRAYINGTGVTLAMLRELGEQLVNIHGQHAHQALGRRDYQREVIDLQAELSEPLRALARLHQAWRETHAQLEQLTTAEDQRLERIRFLEFQLQELHAAALRSGEYAELMERQARLAHASQLQEDVQRAHDLLYEGEIDVHTLLSQALAALEDGVRHDGRLQTALELVGNARIEIDEAAKELRRYLDHLELDPAQLAETDARLAQLQALARKHRCEPEALPERLAALEEELNALTHSDQTTQALHARLQDLEKQWRTLAEDISRARGRCARELETAVTAAMQTLGLEGGRFAVHIQKQASGPPTPWGLDQIEFQVSTNPGQPLQSLARVASGGELSRISLAIQLAAHRDRRIPSLIFDEVDTGIGGGVAEVVGRMLRALGEQHQILCVTHLPQVAAQAHQQLAVQKIKRAESTHTRIRKLEDAERVEELARMLGGVRMTAHTRAHAEEMLKTAQNDADTAG